MKPIYEPKGKAKEYSDYATQRRRLMEININDLNPIHVATCARCGEPGLKRVMIAVSVRRGSQGQFKTLCHFCWQCWVNFLDDYALPEPENW